MLSYLSQPCNKPKLGTKELLRSGRGVTGTSPFQPVKAQKETVMTDRGPADILSDLEVLQSQVAATAAAILEDWMPMIRRNDFADSAANFAAYLALRQHDIRPLQRQLCGWACRRWAAPKPASMRNWRR